MSEAPPTPTEKWQSVPKLQMTAFLKALKDPRYISHVEVRRNSLAAPM